MNGPKLNRDWIGLRVRLKRNAANSYVAFAAGTIGEVISYRGGRNGISFKSEPCPHCAASLIIAGMHRGDFDMEDKRDRRFAISPGDRNTAALIKLALH